MDSITLQAPAKVNLFLKVLEKRPDGYHTIETLFEKIALFDRITLQKTESAVRVSSREKRLPEEKENIAYRAASLFKERYNMPYGVKIGIEKSIPIGAGLGGGSSDAAAVLIGMNRLYKTGIKQAGLELLAKELGADVPFFVSKESWAIGRERGDAVEGIGPDMTLWHMLIVPPVPILSKEAYAWSDTVKKDERPEITGLLGALEESNVRSLGGYLHNDLEGLSFERIALLKKLRSMLIEYGAQGALVSGSGPALFGIFEDEEEVKEAGERLKIEIASEGKNWQVLVVPTLSH